jgi:hypothetical protein
LYFWACFGQTCVQNKEKKKKDDVRLDGFTQIMLNFLILAAKVG